MIVLGLVSQGRAVPTSGALAAVDPAIQPAPKVASTGAEIDTVVRQGNDLYVGGIEGLSILDLSSSISGSVTDPMGYPASGVQVSAAKSITTTTDTGGQYSFSNLTTGSYVITPTLPGFEFLPPQQTVTLPPEARQVNFTVLPGPATALEFPGITMTLSYTDIQGSVTSLMIPGSFYTDTMGVGLSPAMVNAPKRTAWTGHAFDWEATQAGLRAARLAGKPAVATIHYTDFDVKNIKDEDKLTLRFWDGSGWVDTSGTCSPPSTPVLDNSANVVTVPICRTGLYALFGPANPYYLPLIYRN